MVIFLFSSIYDCSVEFDSVGKAGSIGGSLFLGEMGSREEGCDE